MWYCGISSGLSSGGVVIFNWAIDIVFLLRLLWSYFSQWFRGVREIWKTCAKVTGLFSMPLHMSCHFLSNLYYNLESWGSVLGTLCTVDEFNHQIYGNIISISCSFSNKTITNVCAGIAWAKFAAIVLTGSKCIPIWYDDFHLYDNIW